MRLGILTGGGDVPGLNPCIKAFVNRAIDDGHEVIGFRRGWAGLVNYNPEFSMEDNIDHAIMLSKAVVRTVDRTGGTFLHTSRTNPGKLKAKDIPDALKGMVEVDENNDDKTYDLTKHVLRVIESLGIDVLIPIGGDDTLSYADRLHREGVHVNAIPKTMDNDVFGTDYCIGFSTAVSRSEQFIQTLRTTAGSHERIAVIELFGRNSGETSLMTAYLADVDRAIISEVPFDPDRLASLLLKDKLSNPSGYAMMTISEGASILGGRPVEFGEEDSYGHKKLGGIGFITSRIIKKLTSQDVFYQQLAYLMRSGAPDSVDLMVGFNFAQLAIDLINRQSFGRMVAIQNGIYTHVPLTTVTSRVKKVNVDDLYDVDEYRPKIRSIEGKPLFLY
ncbi:MAG: 6-phosphofructokinase [Deltaproteobacteria bacterium]|nr:6-phosphofructokinase [Deltaproteobacteria bacterium]